MTDEQTFEKLYGMRMNGIASALREQLASPQSVDGLTFTDRLAMLVDREWNERENRSLTRRLALARLRDRSACVEDVDYQHPRGLERSALQRLATGAWITKKQNVILTGPTGCGKTYLACALANKACRDGHSVVYRRMPRLAQDLAVARGDGSYARLLARWAKTDVLVLDDWGLAPIAESERRDLLEILDDRHGLRSTIVVSQLPVKDWHRLVGDPTIADALLDRLVHNAHELRLKGESIRKKRSGLTKEES
ncbi:MAG TPA: IS21-like element helper ATPase IstB [Candidatus Binatia bacterium]|nr:IS21-like element helper ATPase IstB [Candidatus Binatia bacterium]